MKSTDTALIDWLANTASMFEGELYSIYLAPSRATPGLPAGSVLRWTDFSDDITYGGLTWKAGGPRLQRGGITTSMQFEVPELTLDIFYRSTDLVDGLTLGAFAENGGFTGAFLTIDWAPMTAPGVLPFGIIRDWSGPIGQVAPSASKVELTVKGANVGFNVQYPFNLYQVPCLNVLFGPACGVNRASFTWSNACASGSTNEVLVPAVALSAMTGQAIAADPGAFADGSITFTGGVNAGTSRGIKVASDGSIILHYGLQQAPGVGDPFTITYGCTHTREVCASRFDNADRYQGFEFIPPAETSA
ncbi:DUF2163 domain-containing protein [Nitrospirillum amazonense]|uniref:DUF2163 domain-containing protein n=1 Tax=Nitrospirillum amazonense TaxID=28077 RepID=UPI0024128A54|nr:DUF2163 domain-containing protein [Nitrospirillum amazonense]MDG3442476.1 DUF2163 domain-containing protein [Nitrospirillum amazonense]